MKIENARSASALAAKIDAVTTLLAGIDQAISEKWPVSDLKVRAPDTDSISPGGTLLSLVLDGPLDDEASTLALSTAKTKYTAILADLNAQLVAL